MIKRLRVFAGPNGAGKTTLVGEVGNNFKENKNFDLGVVVNADSICAQLKEHCQLHLREFRLKTNQKVFNDFCKLPDSVSYLSIFGKPKFHLKDNCFIVDEETSCDLSYDAAFIAAFVRHELCQSGVSFSFETVLSHPSKLGEIEAAKKLGYRIYLYYICYDHVEIIGVERVKTRVHRGGHNVNADKIISRYPLSLKNLREAITLSDRAYLFDNAAEHMEMVAEFHDGRQVFSADQKPEWLSENISD